MKKEITILFTFLVLIFFVSGCGNKSQVTGEVVKDLIEENQTDADNHHFQLSHFNSPFGFGPAIFKVISLPF